MRRLRAFAKLSRLQKAILLSLEGCREPIGINLLRRRLELLGLTPSSPSLSRSLKRLRKRGLIEALRPIRGPEGRVLWLREWSKTKYVTLTREGHSALKKVNFTDVKLAYSAERVNVSRETLTASRQPAPLILVRYQNHPLNLDARDVAPAQQKQVSWNESGEATRRLSGVESRASKLSRQQRAILLCLYASHGMLQIRELRRQLKLLGLRPTSPSLSRSLKRLRDRRLIKTYRILRFRDKVFLYEGGKTAYIALTPEGYRALKKTANVSRGTLTASHEDLGAPAKRSAADGDVDNIPVGKLTLSHRGHPESELQEDDGHLEGSGEADEDKASRGG